MNFYLGWSTGPLDFRVLIFAGTSVYAFEGIALVIPIRESMEKPEYFPHMLVAWTAWMMRIADQDLLGANSRSAIKMHGQYHAIS